MQGAWFGALSFGADLYPAGQPVQGDGVTWSVLGPNLDLHFKTVVDIPEPATVFATSLALSCIALSVKRSNVVRTRRPQSFD